MVFGPVTQELLDQVVEQFQKPDYQDKLKCGVIDPLIAYLHARVYVYLQFIALLMTVMILLLIFLVYLGIRKM